MFPPQTFKTLFLESYSPESIWILMERQRLTAFCVKLHKVREFDSTTFGTLNSAFKYAKSNLKLWSV